MGTLRAVSLGALGLILVLAFAVLLPVVGGGVEDTETPVGVWVESQHITPNDSHEPGVWDNPHHWGVLFGAEVALDGDTLAVSTQTNRHLDSGNETNTGFDWVYVFERGPDGWVQTAKLLPPDPQPQDSFAFSLDLDRDSGVLVAGNPAADELHIFEQDDDGTWEHARKFQRGAWGYAWDVSVSGTTVAASSTGTVFIYDKTDEGWAHTAALDGTAGPLDLAGEQIALRLWPEDREFAVYHRDDSGWTQEVELVPPAPDASGDPVPGSVDLREDGRLAVLGSPTDDRIYGADVPVGVGMSASGSAWIHERTADGWERTAELTNPDPALYEKFGDSVSVSQNRVAIGAPGDLHNGGERAGAVYVYEKTQGEWTLTSKLRNSDGGPVGGGDGFGESVQLQGETLVAGAPYDDNRQDGVPPPLDDESQVPPCISQPVWRCGSGGGAGSVYVFETLGPP